MSMFFSGRGAWITASLGLVAGLCTAVALVVFGQFIAAVLVSCTVLAWLWLRSVSIRDAGKRRTSDRVEPRLSFSESPRFETGGKTAADLLRESRSASGPFSPVPPAGPFSPVRVATLRASFSEDEFQRFKEGWLAGAREYNPIRLAGDLGVSPATRDLARRITPGILAMPIPTEVRAILTELRALAGNGGDDLSDSEGTEV